MPRVIQVPTASYSFAIAPDSLSTIGIGSCVVICLYSIEKKTGALLHCMLPREENDTSNSLRNLDTAIDKSLKEFKLLGITTEQITAKLVGGADMFNSMDYDNSIGGKNIKEAKLILNSLHIPIIAEETGGNRARNLLFDLNSGKITINTAKRIQESKFDSEQDKIL